MCRKLSCLASFVLVLALAGASAAQVVDASLVGWWKFDEGVGAVAADSSGQGNNGSLHGPVEWTDAGKIGGALKFTGPYNYVLVQSSPELNPTQAITIAAWINPSWTGNNRILQKSTEGSDNQYRLLKEGGNNIRFHIPPAANFEVTGKIPPNGEWTHLAATYDGSMIRVYFNAVVVGERAWSGTMGTSDGPLFIGTKWSKAPAGDEFNGMMDDVRIYNRALSAGEIKILGGESKASSPAPADRGIHPDTWANLAWTPGAFAVSHNVYFSDNVDAVKNSTAEAFLGNETSAYLFLGFPGFPYPNGFVEGTTYYWRVDEVNDLNPNSPWVGKVWSFTVPPKIAWNPSPRNGAKFVDPDADLSWSAGWGARLHTVYFGDKFDDVNNATGGSRQTTTTYTLAKLEAGKTYYWRVDEFDVVTTHKGDIWSFTTAGPGGGILGEYFNNVNVTGTPALVRIDPAVSINLTGATSPGAPVPGDGWSARWTADLDIVFDDTYTFSVNSQDGTRLWIDDKLVINVWVAWVTTEYASLPIPLKAGIHSLRLEYFDSGGDAVQVLYWTTPTQAKQIVPAGPLQTPVLARRPIPIDGTAGVNLMLPLTWKPGHAAVSHEVYFGTDAQAVANATKTSPEYKGTKAVGAETLDQGKLAFDTTYFWRVDEVNNANPKSPWIGNVWSFWTGNFLVVDDFESYNDIDPPGAGSNRIFDKWIDGFGTTTNGAVVGNNLPPYAAVGVLHGGAQAMPYTYDNNLKTSEATMTLVYPRDWTEQGVTKLSLWFQGAATNSADRMFVALNGTAVVYHDNPAATQSKGWNEWVIDLQAFASKGVNLTNVNTVTIGVGTKNTPAAGGTGTIYFDDIRLYRP